MSDRLPSGWAPARLEQIVRAQKGKKAAVMRDGPAKGFVPYLDIHAIEKHEVRQFAEVKSSRVASEHDLFVVWDGARSGWVGGGITGAIGSTIMALTPQEVESGYVRYYIASQFQILNTKTRGTGIPHVDPEIFWNLAVPLAPLAEQSRIVAKLETVLGRVCDCQKRLARIALILKRFRQAVLATACSGRLTEDWREDHPGVPAASELLESIRERRLSLATSRKETAQIAKAFEEQAPHTHGDELGFDLIPATWTVCLVGAIGAVSNGSTPPRKESTYWGGDIPWVSSGEVRNNRISQTRERITRAGYENSSVKLLPPGTVLLAMIGEGKTRGQSAILDIEATINQNIAAVVLAHGLVVPEYLWFWFQLQYESTRRAGGGSGPQALNCQRVRELPFVLPPFEEQKEIARRIGSLLALADQLETRYMKAQAHMDRLTPSILDKAFRGDLVPTEAELAAEEGREYETAAELLQRISEIKAASAGTIRPGRRRTAKQKAPARPRRRS